jgi:RNA polymerase-binding transcription factor DksA
MRSEGTMAGQHREPDVQESDRGYDEATHQGAPYEQEVYGRVVDASSSESVDGDPNGAPELESLQESETWEGADVLDALHGPDAQAQSVQTEEPLASQRRADLERRRAEAVERLETSRPGFTAGELQSRGIGAAVPPSDASDELETIQALEQQIDQIDRALERLESEEYGCCLSCGNPIGPILLDEQPERELCEICAREGSAFVSA